MELAMHVATRPPRGLCAIAAALDIGWPEIKYFCFRVIPGNVFGLLIYTFQLARGQLVPELRRTVSIALAIGWAVTIVATAASLIFPPGGAAMGVSWEYTACVSGYLLALAGSLVYNRVTYGFYL